MSWGRVVVIAAFSCACSSLKEADQDRNATEPDEDGGTAQDERPSGSEDPPGPKDPAAVASAVEEVPLTNDAVIAGSLSISAGTDGEAVVGWLDTPSGTRHLRIAQIAGNESPPRIAGVSDTPLESNAYSIGQAVSVFAPSKGCFGVVYGQSKQLFAAAVGAGAQLEPASVIATLEYTELPLSRLSQIRAVPDQTGGVFVAWAEQPRTTSSFEPRGSYRTASLAFAGCSPGAVVVNANPLATELPYRPPPGGAAEIAIARIGKAYRAAFQVAKGEVLELLERSGGADSFSAPAEIDDGGTHGAGGSVGIAPNGDGHVTVYYRRTSDTTGDLVAVSVAKENGSPKETILEHDVLIGMSAATWLEASRAAVAGRSGVKNSAVIAAAFPRDAKTSEVRVYFADSAAPNGFRSQLVATDVFGPRSGGDAHALVDVAVDGSGRAHVAWRSGASKSVTYARVPRP